MPRTPQASTPARPTARRAKKKAAKKKVVKNTEEIDDADLLTHVEATRCSNCFDIVYSRCLHDVRYCSCRRTAISGGPLNAALVDGSSDLGIIKLAGPFSLKAMAADYSQGQGQMGRVKYPAPNFRYLAMEAFPASFHSYAHRPGVDSERVRIDIRLVAPRSVPQGAPTSKSSSGAKLWEHNGSVLGKVRMEVSGIDRGVISSTEALVKLMDIESLKDCGRNQIRQYRSGWASALLHLSNEVPLWWEDPPAIHELIFMDVMALGSVSTEGAYRRSLLGKRRIGKLIPSIMATSR